MFVVLWEKPHYLEKHFILATLEVFSSPLIVLVEFLSFCGQRLYSPMSAQSFVKGNILNVISWELYNLRGINISYFCWEADIPLKSHRFHLLRLSDCIKLTFRLFFPAQTLAALTSPLITSLSESPFVVLCLFSLVSLLFLLISILEEIILMEVKPNVPKMAFPKNWDLIALALLNGGIRKE